MFLLDLKYGNVVLELLFVQLLKIVEFPISDGLF